jgi:3-hydroxy-9,10-secoandrosta-1,3,5(10)-triene-9,17-dione monooxygenase
MSGAVRSRSVVVPEPDLTPDQMVARATALIPLLREEQEATERRGVHSPEIHEQFRKAGFYRCLQPRMYGGYEFDVTTYYRIAMELGRGDPSTSWCLTVGGGHTLLLGSYFEEDAQAAGFGPDGEFSAPSVAAPQGTATATKDGWFVKGQWGYASGAPYSTHFMPSVLIPTGEGNPPLSGIALIPRSDWQMLDDWGAILGLKGSGSNSIRVDGAELPRSHVIQLDMTDIDVSEGTPGSRLHNNGMYAGRSMSFFHGELVSVMVGLGYAALDEYEEIIRTKKTLVAPIMPRYLRSDYQRYLGLALGLLNAAKRLCIDAGDTYMECCRRGHEGGEPFTLEEDIELMASLEHAGRLVFEAVEMLFRTASSGAARDGQRMQRYYRDISIYRGHVSAQYDNVAEMLGKIHLGVGQGIKTSDRAALYQPELTSGAKS